MKKSFYTTIALNHLILMMCMLVKKQKTTNESNQRTISVHFLILVEIVASSWITLLDKVSKLKFCSFVFTLKYLQHSVHIKV